MSSGAGRETASKGVARHRGSRAARATWNVEIISLKGFERLLMAFANVNADLKTKMVFKAYLMTS